MVQWFQFFAEKSDLTISMIFQLSRIFLGEADKIFVQIIKSFVSDQDIFLFIIWVQFFYP